MSDEKFYIGFRVEVASRVIPNNIQSTISTYNASGTALITDLQTNGKITVDKSNGMVVAGGVPDKRKATKQANINFAVLTPIQELKELQRIVQIINVLGNGRLIRERVKIFVDGQSTLNQIPELQNLQTALARINKFMPGFVLGAWYYAPEAIFECEKK